MDDEILRLSVVDRSDVDSQCLRPALLDQKTSGSFTEAREMQSRYVTGRIVAEVALPVGPALAPVSSQKHDRSRANASVSALESEHVVSREAVIAVRCCLTGDVDYNSRSDELIERNLVTRIFPFREVNRCIEMCAAVLRGTERICGIEPSALRAPERESVELERGG